MLARSKDLVENPPAQDYQAVQILDMVSRQDTGLLYSFGDKTGT